MSDHIIYSVILISAAFLILFIKSYKKWKTNSGERLDNFSLQIASSNRLKLSATEKWEEILQLYNQLLIINYSPGAALNRTFALYKANGAALALVQAEKLKLENNHFYFILLGELYKNIDKNKAIAYLEKSQTLAKNPAERQVIQQKIEDIR